MSEKLLVGKDVAMGFGLQSGQKLKRVRPPWEDEMLLARRDAAMRFRVLPYYHRGVHTKMKLVKIRRCCSGEVLNIRLHIINGVWWLERPCSRRWHGTGLEECCDEVQILAISLAQRCTSSTIDLLGHFSEKPPGPWWQIPNLNVKTFKHLPAQSHPLPILPSPSSSKWMWVQCSHGSFWILMRPMFSMCHDSELPQW